MSRTETSPYRYDRAEIRRVLETEGLAEARMRFPDLVVMPMARAMGLTRQYRPTDTWQPEWNALLGTKPDTQIAGELGLAVITVSSQRRKLGIPAITAAERRAAKLSRIHARLAELSDDDLMQSMLAVAEVTRASCDHIKAERVKRGLVMDPRAYRYRQGPHILKEMRRVCIRAMLAANPAIALNQMAAVLGVSRERIRQLVELEAFEKPESVGAVDPHAEVSNV